MDIRKNEKEKRAGRKAKKALKKEGKCPFFSAFFASP